MRALCIIAAAMSVPASALAESEMCMVVPASFDADAPLVLEVEAPVPAPAPQPEGVVLWCTNSDDPRCSPIHHEDRPENEWQSVPLRTLAPNHSDVADPSATRAQFVTTQTAPSSGVSRRVERPPRA